MRAAPRRIWPRCPPRSSPTWWPVRTGDKAMRPQPHHDEPISPDEINVDGARLDRARDVLRRGVDENAFPGAVVCALRRGQIFLHEAVGTLDGERPAATNTIYDLASLTKPLATAASTL